MAAYDRARTALLDAYAELEAIESHFTQVLVQLEGDTETKSPDPSLADIGGLFSFLEDVRTDIEQLVACETRIRKQLSAVDNERLDREARRRHAVAA